jgi:hypothetical protein
VLGWVFGLRSSVFGLQSSVCRIRVQGLWVIVYGFGVFPTRSSVFGLRSSVFGLRSLVFGLRWSSGYRFVFCLCGLQSSVRPVSVLSSVQFVAKTTATPTARDHDQSIQLTADLSINHCGDSKAEHHLLSRSNSPPGETSRPL